MRFLFLLFIIVPIIEITLLIQVGQAIGAWYTVGLVLLSAFIGVNMLRYQSVSTLARAQQRANQGEIPGREMVEGIVLAVGGALLVTPGFVTDVIGFCCLIPYTRQAFANAMISRFTVVAMNSRQASFESTFGGPGFDPSSPEGFESKEQSQQEGAHYADSPFRKDKPQSHGGDVIDGEYQRKE
ncbi:FxsA family protein [Pontibacterium sp.]|uniref:FxsA family protein n=1 Tax=Pontibacterium sp. TaxID=2036026 RepID=UPI003510F4BA